MIPKVNLIFQSNQSHLGELIFKKKCEVHVSSLFGDFGVFQSSDALLEVYVNICKLINLSTNSLFENPAKTT